MADNSDDGALAVQSEGEPTELSMQEWRDDPNQPAPKWGAKGGGQQQQKYPPVPDFKQACKSEAGDSIKSESRSGRSPTPVPEERDPPEWREQEHENTEQWAEQGHGRWTSGTSSLGSSWAVETNASSSWSQPPKPHGQKHSRDIDELTPSLPKKHQSRADAVCTAIDAEEMEQQAWLTQPAMTTDTFQAEIVDRVKYEENSCTMPLHVDEDICVEIMTRTAHCPALLHMYCTAQWDYNQDKGITITVWDYDDPHDRVNTWKVILALFVVAVAANYEYLASHNWPIGQKRNWQWKWQMPILLPSLAPIDQEALTRAKDEPMGQDEQQSDQQEWPGWNSEDWSAKREYWNYDDQTSKEWKKAEPATDFELGSGGEKEGVETL